MKVCIIEECNKLIKSRRLCSKHYKAEYNTRSDIKNREIHGMTKTTEYSSWLAMKSRCLNSKNKDFKYYGGRGINICNEWKNSFLSFYSDMGKKPFDNYSIDRIDNNKEYSKNNCKWSSKSDQAINRRVKSSSKTGVSGVSFCNTHKEYKAYINKNGVRYNLGNFKSIEEAIQSRKQAELKYW